jgi:hypothetical protein
LVHYRSLTGVDIAFPERQHRQGAISIYRGYRDWWKALELRQPGVAVLLRVAGFMVGLVLGGLLIHSLDVWLLVIALIGSTITATWTSFRRRPGRGRTG